MNSSQCLIIIINKEIKHSSSLNIKNSIMKKVSIAVVRHRYSLSGFTELYSIPCCHGDGDDGAHDDVHGVRDDFRQNGHQHEGEIHGVHGVHGDRGVHGDDGLHPNVHLYEELHDDHDDHGDHDDVRDGVHVHGDPINDVIPCFL